MKTTVDYVNHEVTVTFTVLEAYKIGVALRAGSSDEELVRVLAGELTNAAYYVDRDGKRGET
jgi:hypothetical protein